MLLEENEYLNSYKGINENMRNINIDQNLTAKDRRTSSEVKSSYWSYR